MQPTWRNDHGRGEHETLHLAPQTPSSKFQTPAKTKPVKRYTNQALKKWNCSRGITSSGHGISPWSSKIEINGGNGSNRELWESEGTMRERKRGRGKKAGAVHDRF